MPIPDPSPVAPWPRPVGSGRPGVARLSLALLSVLSVLSVLFGVGAASAEPGASGGSPSSALAWARSHYLEPGAPVCSVAEIAEVLDRAPVIVVRLTIDPRWAKDLERMASGLRSDWFALHCPFILEPVWQLLPPDGDVVIEAPVPGLGVVRHGCRPLPAASGG
ncbi:hypothetical protein [Roseospira navarrensis]|uniref:Uncharacterized protein n=1 Tax=Roseospira navarrensis TaxID=140058 RepID=A0A7X1ZCB9_9PROT|nr:hypothetical protein [Roseospira navarrensis]MQX35945.1 hypothetical protein [Roseospira navarrensis]